MVLVSFCWYLDQQVKATEGKWKVNIDFYLITLREFKLFLITMAHFKWICPLMMPDCLYFLGLRCGQTHTPS